MKSCMRLCVFLLFIPSAFSSIPQQTQNHPGQYSPQDNSVFKVSDPILLEGKVVHGSIRKPDIDTLLDLRIELTGSGQEDKYGLELTDQAGNKFPVFTCREWVKELSDGSYAATTYDITMEAYFIRTCCFLYALKEAKPAKKSFIEKPRRGLFNLNLLPVSMIRSTWGGDEELEEQANRGITISRLVSKGEVEIDERTKTKLWLTYGDMYLAFAEIGRADFNRDGIEDIFISSSEYATSGSFRSYHYLILTRRSRSAIFEPVVLNSDLFRKSSSPSAMEFDLKTSDMKQTKLTKQEYGDDWPFIVDEGILGCARVGSIAVFLTADDKTYALNGWARGNKIDGKAVSPDIAEIQESGQASLITDERNGLNKIINRGIAMCK